MVRPSAGSTLIVLLVALVALQGVALLGVAGFYLAELARGGAANAPGASFAGVATLVVAAGLLLAARGLYRRRRWSRAPVLVVQLLVALVAVGPDGVVHGGLWYVALPLFGWALIVVSLLFAPPVSAALEED